MSVKAVILDIDGTLLDSNSAHAGAWLEMCREGNIDKHPDDVRRLIGIGGDKLVRELFGVEKSSPEGKKISERRLQLFKDKFLPDIKPFPGVRDLLEKCKASGLRLAVASSANRAELEEFVKLLDIKDLLEVTVAGSDADASKPDPDIVTAAVKKLGLLPGECVMVGDTPYDLEAAGRAGVPAISLRCGGFWSEEDLRNGAAEVYDSPMDLFQNFNKFILGLPMLAGAQPGSTSAARDESSMGEQAGAQQPPPPRSSYPLFPAGCT